MSKSIKLATSDYVSSSWKAGDGANSDDWKAHKKIEVDPYAEDRSPLNNYKLLISAVAPRPVGFVSTVSKDGDLNLSPFSYFNVFNSDPPVFCIGVSNGRAIKDTALNLIDNGELTINIVSEWYIEAANYTAIDAPRDVDEWKLAGLTQLKSTKVKPPHVAESAFSIEAKVLHHHELKSPKTGNVSGHLFVVEGINFHVREDVTNEEVNDIDLEKLRPVGRLGGIKYEPTVEIFEAGRAVFAEDKEKPEVKKALE